MQDNKFNLFRDFDTFSSLLLVVLLVFAAYFRSTTLYYTIVGLSLFYIRKPVVIFPVFFIATMSDTFFAIRVGLSVGRFLSLIMIASCVVRWHICRVQLNSNNFILAVVLVVFTAFSAWLGYDGGSNIIIIMLMNLSVFFLFSRIPDVDLTKLMVVLSIGVFLFLIMMYLKASLEGAFLFEERYNANDEVNSNRLAIMAEQCGAVLLGFSFFFENKKLKFVNILRLLYVLGVIIAGYLILATGSRSGLLALLGALFLCVLLVVVKRKGKRNNLIILIVVVVLGVVYTAVSKMDNKIMDRYTVENVQSNGGAGRADNAEVVLAIFQDHLLFGSGIGTRNMHVLIKKSGYYGDASHNIIIDPLTQMGIIGFGLYLILILQVIRKGFRITKSKEVAYFMAIIPFVAAVINGIGEVIFYEKLFWNDMALLVLAYNTMVNNDAALIAKQ